MDLILLLQCSFILVQKKSEDPFSLAVQKYKASGISTQIFKTQDRLFVRYSAANNKEEKVKVIMDVILHHQLGRLESDMHSLLYTNLIS